MCSSDLRRVYNQWQSSIPSRFIEELPRDAVEQEIDAGLYGNATSPANPFPGFSESSRAGAGFRRAPRMVEAESWEEVGRGREHTFEVGDRIFHQKFGYGVVEAIDGTKLDIAFDKAGRKKVLDSFIQPA